MMDRPEVSGFGVRHVQVILMFFWNVLFTSMVNGFPMSLVAMTTPFTSPNPNIPTFTDWNDQSIILSSFFWGFVATQLFGGYYARKYGVKWFMVPSMFITAIICFSLPYLVVQFGSIGLIFAVVVAGCAQGLSHSMLPVFISLWVPCKEKNTLGNAVYAGYGLGCILGINIATYCATSWFGWPLSFYITAVMQFSWGCFMSMFGGNYPQSHRTISDKELEFILEDKNLHEQIPTPWREILNSRPVWALWIANGGAIIITWLSAAEFPTYLSEVFDYKIEEVGNIMSLAFLLIGLLSFFVGIVVEYFINVKQVETGIMRKICNTVASLGCSIILIRMAFFDGTESKTVLYSILGVFAFNSTSFCGYLLNYNDISPNFCGILFGLGGVVASVMNLGNPVLMTIYVRNQSDPREWGLIFFISALIMIVANLVFVFFGSGEKQEWDDFNEERKSLRNS
ncbi:putative inorganic phosphate cotransporter [Harmonia axyridis]|uniref:putative inorganic phosphate cotransporter n=1 Tax=Harmonia axyridis TaxID=115357 RepID=UPI001E279CCB|nr:putative inorganic phosphate cotransporter [Harmonia axyridis]